VYSAGANLELVAWGLRNAFGLHHYPDGRLFATEYGIDERSPHFIVGDPQWGDGGCGRDPVIAEPPGTPPEPFVSFTPHAAANGFDLSTDERFGFVGDAFVACSGDAAPVTTRRIVPADFKVVRVDMVGRRVVDLAVNRISGGASILTHEGGMRAVVQDPCFERPVDCRLGPDGCLYVAYWGEMVPAPERAGVEIRLGTGVLWRIRPTGDRHGDVPPEPRVLPLNLLRAVVPTAAATAAGAVVRARLKARRRPGTASLRASPLERDELFILGPQRHRSQCGGAGRVVTCLGTWRSDGHS
jgi:hypothetical protein